MRVLLLLYDYIGPRVCLLLTPSSIGKLLRRLHARRARDPVPEELRGWSYWRPPLRPRAFLGLGVSEVAYRYCPSRRDVWLRRHRGVDAGPSGSMLRGRVVHEAFRQSARDVVRLYAKGVEPADMVSEIVSVSHTRAREILASTASAGVDGLEELASRAYKRFGFYWASWVEETGQPPWYVEYVVDGSLIGLSPRLRVDALGVGFVVEVKLGQWREEYTTGLAGYALALEASHDLPVDYGVVILVSGDASRVEAVPVYLGSDERIAFIEARDELIELLLSGVDPGMPGRCPKSCPFVRVCNPPGVEA